MLLKGFPDFIEYNNTQAAKGRPKVSWPEFQRLRKGALIRQEASTSLQEAVEAEPRTRSQRLLHGQSIKLLPLYPDPKEQSVRAPEASSEGILELTPDMEVDPEGRDGTSCLPDLPQAISVHALCDGSGPIGSI